MSRENVNLRYERKLVPQNSDPLEVLTKIRCLPQCFREVYPPRYISNIYFDSVTLKNYFDNIEGVPLRAKVRIRWYGELFGSVHPVLEIKRKAGLVGYKVHYPLNSFRFICGISGNEISRVIDHSTMSAGDFTQVVQVRPFLVNHYLRRYFVCEHSALRLTVDTDLTYREILPAANEFLNPRSDPDRVILEFKYSPEHENLADRIIGALPYRVSKKSKYVSGMELIFAERLLASHQL